MTVPEMLIDECDRREVILEHGGQKLRVTPNDRVPPELMEQLRRHKWEILEILEFRNRSAAQHLAKQILMGEFEGCDDSTRRTLAATVLSFPRPLVRRALKKLNEC